MVKKHPSLASSSRVDDPVSSQESSGPSRQQDIPSSVNGEPPAHQISGGERTPSLRDLFSSDEGDDNGSVGSEGLEEEVCEEFASDSSDQEEQEDSSTSDDDEGEHDVDDEDDLEDSQESDDSIGDEEDKGGGRNDGSREEEDLTNKDSQSSAARKAPPRIKFQDATVDVQFHPTDNYIVLGSINGEVLLYSYTRQERKQVKIFKHHRKFCRRVAFSSDGFDLFSIASDRRLVQLDLRAEKVIKEFSDIHEDSPYSLLIFQDDNLAATGDDDGQVKGRCSRSYDVQYLVARFVELFFFTFSYLSVWDLRQSRSVMSFKQMEGTVHDMTAANDVLLCASGEGTLTAFSIRAKKMEMQSEVYEGELTGIALMRQGTKVVVGGAEGKLFAFNWGSFGYHASEFTSKHVTPINSIRAVNDHILLTGTDDGVVRAVHLFPDRPLGIVGQHEELFGVERLTVSKDLDLAASCGYENAVRFWDIEYLKEVKVNDREKSRKRGMDKHLPSSRYEDRGAFFSGLE
ncbi:unnamed protein product [Cyprideis torosa]|uniref:WD repeat-containing protein 55 homolog n=1 Tax=Cyprideis torosa TaxID=163714 RepID=A0A7R8WAQ2_9CRUS|nr:unnamed protein product [Cyprideis torosa]CAG0891288.1 unnamed protein product [Cyprideis torosa]